LQGTATFLRLPKLAAALESVSADRELHVHFERLDYIDHACLDLLLNWEKQHAATGGSLVIDWERLTARFHDYHNKCNGKSGEPVDETSTNHGTGDTENDGQCCEEATIRTRVPTSTN
jgi:hypothetical protein